MCLQVPFLFKYAIDALTADPLGQTLAQMPMVQLLPATVLLGYGAARAASSLCNELRNAVFAKVTLLLRPSHLSSYPPLRSCPQRSYWAMTQRAERVPSANRCATPISSR
jgi:hypothetical protein